MFSFSVHIPTALQRDSLLAVLHSELSRSVAVSHSTRQELEEISKIRFGELSYSVTLESQIDKVGAFGSTRKRIACDLKPITSDKATFQKVVKVSESFLDCKWRISSRAETLDSTPTKLWTSRSTHRREVSENSKHYAIKLSSRRKRKNVIDRHFFACFLLPPSIKNGKRSPACVLRLREGWLGQSVHRSFVNHSLKGAFACKSLRSDCVTNRMTRSGDTRRSSERVLVWWRSHFLLLGLQLVFA